MSDSTPRTPEHVQLLSDRRLDEVARDIPEGSDDDARSRRALARTARFEQRRRTCDVPVRNRYGTADA